MQVQTLPGPPLRFRTGFRAASALDEQREFCVEFRASTGDAALGSSDCGFSVQFGPERVNAARIVLHEIRCNHVPVVSGVYWKRPIALFTR